MLKVLSQLSSSSHWPKEDHHCTQKQLRSLETVVSRVKPEMTPINRKVANLLVRDGYWPSHALILISRSSDTKPAAPIPEQPGPSSRGASLLDSEHRGSRQHCHVSHCTMIPGARGPAELLTGQHQSLSIALPAVIRNLCWETLGVLTTPQDSSSQGKPPHKDDKIRLIGDKAPNHFH